MRRLLLGILLCAISCGATSEQSAALANWTAAGKLDVAHAAWWGYRADDATEALRRAFASGAKKLVISRQAGPWIVTEPLRLPSDMEIIFEDGAEIRAAAGAFKGRSDSLLVGRDCRNLTLRGKGILRMKRSDYRDPKKYKPAEWRNCLSLLGGRKILIDGLSMLESGGDGIYLNNVEDTVIRNVVCDRNYRQGISVISAKNLRIIDCAFLNTDGTAPMAGIDFEPNKSSEQLVDCLIERCRFAGNTGAGIEFALVNLPPKSVPISVTIRNCEIVNNRKGGVILVNRRTPGPRGKIIFENCRIGGTGNVAFRAEGQLLDGYSVRLANCTIDNSRMKSFASVELSARMVQGTCGNMTFDNVTATDGKPGAMAFAFDGFRIFALDRLQGAIVLNGKPMDLAEYSACARKKQIAAARFNLNALKPIDGGAAKRTMSAANMVRSPFTFVQYAEPESEIVVKATLKQVGANRRNASIAVTAPNGSTVKTYEITPGDAAREIRFRAVAAGFYRFRCTPNGQALTLRSDAPGCGILAESPVQMYKAPSHYYFLVPARSREVAFQLYGFPGEWLTVELLRPDGRVAARGKHVEGMALLVCERGAAVRDEVWSIRIPAAIEDHTVMPLGEIIPILADSPEKLLVKKLVKKED